MYLLNFLDADVSEEAVVCFSTVAPHSPPWEFQILHLSLGGQISGKGLAWKELSSFDFIA